MDICNRCEITNQKKLALFLMVILANQPLLNNVDGIILFLFESIVLIIINGKYWNQQRQKLLILYMLIVFSNRILLFTFKGMALLFLASVILIMISKKKDSKIWNNSAFVFVAVLLFLQTHQYPTYSMMSINNHGERLQVFYRRIQFTETDYQFQVFEKSYFLYNKRNKSMIRYILTTGHFKTGARQAFKIAWPQFKRDEHQTNLYIY
ncbi:MAG: hypothetical protein ABF920_08035 [Lacticaseibacillus paracasei]|uniref:hypothetical protein n=1 Tax=Lacticaseibacillus paracasei TaxID=1597 RepID=UPI00345D49B8